MKILKILLILLVLTALYNLIMTELDVEDHPAPGRLIEVNGHKMHIYGEGQGTPTVVYTAGAGTASAVLDFAAIQRAISDKTRVVVYERPGYGWSEKAKTPRTTEQIVKELHELLVSAGEKPPYIFVGHSMGALEVLDYTQKYPGEVAGILLIDGKSPYMSLKYSGVRAMETILGYSLSFLRLTGLVRIASYFKLPSNVFEDIEKLPEDVREAMKVMYLKNLMNADVLSERGGQEETAERLIGIGTVGDIPMTIINSAINSKRIPEWEDTQRELLKWSRNGKWVSLEDADHYVHLYRPDIVIREINELVDGATGR